MATRGASRLQRVSKTKEIAGEPKENGLRRSPRNRPAQSQEKSARESEVQKERRDFSVLPSIVFKGRINYVNNFGDCAMICDNILKVVESNQNENVPIGFDLEWPFSFQTGSGKTALAQICLSYTECHLLHIYSLKKLPASFVLLLSHPKVKLVGVNVKNDVWKLGRDFKEFPAQKVVENNCVDTGTFTNRVFSRSCRWSLEKLTAYLLKKKISKDPKVRKSQWHVQPLSKEQKIYAATDAFVSWLLHKKILEESLTIAAESTIEDPLPI